MQSNAKQENTLHSSPPNPFSSTFFAQPHFFHLLYNHSYRQGTGLAQNSTILFLYTELAGYFLACVRTLLEEHPVDVHIIRWPVNKEAPFNFGESSNISFYERNDYTDDQLIALAKEINPDIIVCSGWIDKGYLKTVKSFGKKIPSVITIDNHWFGSAKQQVARMLSPFVLKSKFTHAWVPGSPQVEYAKKLGFKNIETGFYSADVPLFKAQHEANRSAKTKAFPHRFIYIGRYLEFKGIFDMWSAFAKLHEEQENDWELWCLGTGDLYDQRIEHPKIKHFGFVQPDELKEYIQKTGVFILPSHKEPWAVTVHEFAAAGFPLICSDKVGAIDRFVEEGQNGYVFPSGDETALLKTMKSIVAKSDDELLKMGEKSIELADQITPSRWSQTLINMMN